MANCREDSLGKNDKSFTIDNGSEISQLRYVEFFQKRKLQPWRPLEVFFCWVPRWKIIDLIVIFYVRPQQLKSFVTSFFNSPLDTWWHVVPQISSTQILGSISDLRLSRTHRRTLGCQFKTCFNCTSSAVQVVFVRLIPIRCTFIWSLNLFSRNMFNCTIVGGRNFVFSHTGLDIFSICCDSMWYCYCHFRFEKDRKSVV